MKMTFAVVVMPKVESVAAFGEKKGKLDFTFPSFIIMTYSHLVGICHNGFCGDGDDVNDDNDNVTVDSVLMTKH